MIKVLVILLTAFFLIEGCLITNCPKGGKRSSLSLGVHHRFRDALIIKKDTTCRRCGPGLEGQCIGPSICCGPRIGCLVGTPTILSQCTDQPPELPRNTKSCSIGTCLSDGVCCSSDGCRIDFSCEMETSTDACAQSEQSAKYF